MNERPDSILITMGLAQVKERGFSKIVEQFMKSDGLQFTYWYKSANSPKYPNEIIWVYWVIGGRIRWRCRLLEVQKNRTVPFSDGTTQFAKRWLVMYQFQSIPKKAQIEQKGFQGFRYFNSSSINM